MIATEKSATYRSIREQLDAKIWNDAKGLHYACSQLRIDMQV